MFAGTIFIFFANIANTILRAEGDAKRAMIAMMIGAILNIVLDPICIFGKTNPGPFFIKPITDVIGLDMGIGGAAYATVISMLISSIIIVFWLFVKKDTYICFDFRKFKFDKAILKDIFKVGIPAMFMHVSMSIMMFFENFMVVYVAGIEGIAVLTAGWRMLMIAILPTMGVATAVVAVCGAAYGAKKFGKLSSAYSFAIKFGLAIELIVGVIVFFLAPYIVKLFTSGEGGADIENDLITFIRIMVFFFPAVAFGMLSSSMFQGIGKGLNALIVTVLRTLVCMLPLAFLYGIVLGWGLEGIWFGTVIGTLLAGSIAFYWGRTVIKNQAEGKLSPVDKLIGRYFKGHNEGRKH